jgi:hypothetical protein
LNRGSERKGKMERRRKKKMGGLLKLWMWMD